MEEGAREKQGSETKEMSRGLRILKVALFEALRIGLMLALVYTALGATLLVLVSTSAPNNEFMSAILTLHQEFSNDPILSWFMRLTPEMSLLSMVSIISLYFRSTFKWFGFDSSKIKQRFSP